MRYPSHERSLIARYKQRDMKRLLLSFLTFSTLTLRVPRKKEVTAKSLSIGNANMCS